MPRLPSNTPIGRSWKLQERRAGSSSQVDQASCFHKTTQFPNSQLQEATRLQGQLPTQPKPKAPFTKFCCGQFLLSVGWKGSRRQTQPTLRSSLGREGDEEMQITQGRLPQGWGPPKS